MAEERERERERVAKRIKSDPRARDYRFDPTDGAIVRRWLRMKADGKSLRWWVPIRDAVADDVFGVAPWQLLASIPEKAQPFDPRPDHYYFFTKKKRNSGWGMWKTKSWVEIIEDHRTETELGYKRKLIYPVDTDIPNTSSTTTTSEKKWFMKLYSLPPTKPINEEVQEEENQEQWVLCKIINKVVTRNDAPSDEDDDGEFVGKHGDLNKEMHRFLGSHYQSGRHSVRCYP